MQKDSYLGASSLMSTYTTPPTPEYTKHPAAFNYPSTHYSDSHIRVDSSMSSWHSSRGLGVVLSAAESDYYYSGEREMEHYYPSAALAPSLKTQTAPRYQYDAIAPPYRTPTETPRSAAEDMWSMMPQPAWDHSRNQPFEAGYCPGSVASSMSSPYTTTAQLARATASPMIKNEHSPVIKYEDQEYHDRIVRPSDLVTQAPLIGAFPACSPFMTPVTPQEALSPPDESQYDSVSQGSPAWSEEPVQPVRPRRRRPAARDNANCRCEECGVGFKRASNLCAHMQTHDTTREHAYPCLYEGCDKAFHRRTDMQRHQKSVHNKIKDHQCDLCERLFARKDTLERHRGQGCPKRTAILARDRIGKNRRTPYPVRDVSHS